MDIAYQRKLFKAWLKSECVEVNWERMMRFDDTVYNFFGKNLESATDKSRLNPSVGSYGGRDLGGVHCPGIILSSFQLTL